MKDDSENVCQMCGQRTAYRCDLCRRPLCYRHFRHPHLVIPGTTQRASHRSDLCDTCLAWSESEAKHPQPLPKWLRGLAPEGDGVKWN